HAEIVDHRLAAEALGEPFDPDRDAPLLPRERVGVGVAAHSVTSTGCPGCSFAASAAEDTRASIGAAHPSQASFTACPTLTAPSFVSGTKKRAFTLAGGSSETTGAPA